MKHEEGKGMEGIRVFLTNLISSCIILCGTVGIGDGLLVKYDLTNNL